MYASAVRYHPIRRPRPPNPWKKAIRQLAVGLGVLIALGFGFAQVAHGGAPSAYETITVAPGDTLWGIASQRYPHSDVRQKVGEIEAANGLPGPALKVGARLRVPTD